MANRDDDRMRGGQGGSEGGQGGDSEDDLQRALERRTEDLAGDLETNRNMSGSTTYETLSEEGDLDVSQGSERGNREGNG